MLNYQANYLIQVQFYVKNKVKGLKTIFTLSPANVFRPTAVTQLIIN